jgi:hypothetical protein
MQSREARRMAERVVDKVAHDLAQAFFIAANDGGPGDLHRHRSLGLHKANVGSGVA